MESRHLDASKHIGKGIYMWIESAGVFESASLPIPNPCLRSLKCISPIISVQTLHAHRSLSKLSYTVPSQSVNRLAFESASLPILNPSICSFIRTSHTFSGQTVHSVKFYCLFLP